MACHYTYTMGLGTQLLPGSRTELSVRTCRTVVGDDLKNVTYFIYNRCGQIYLRNNLEVDADLTGFVEHETDGLQARTAYRSSELGDYHYIARVFDHGYLTQVAADDKGVFATTDGLTLRHSEELISAPGELLRG